MSKKKNPSYDKCLNCGKSKNTRYEKESKHCKDCSALLRRGSDLDEERICSLCESVLPNTEAFFAKYKEKDGIIFRRRTCRDCDDLRRKKYALANPEKVKQSGKEAAKRSRQNMTPTQRLRRCVSERVRQALKSGPGKNYISILAYLPYTLQELKEHIEKQFTPEMSWDNYGSYFVIDHVIPHSVFHYNSMEDVAFRECWALENLRPLEKHLNLIKSDRYPSPDEIASFQAYLLSLDSKAL